MALLRATLLFYAVLSVSQAFNMLPESRTGWIDSSPSTSSILAKPAISNEAFENGISGFYDIDHKIHGDGDKNPWYNVEITWNPTKGAFTWKNRAGVTWTLTPMMGPSGGLDRTKLAVGNDCPYKNDGHEFAKIEWVS